MGALPWLAAFCVYCHTLLLGEINIVQMTPLSEDSRSLTPGSSWVLPCASLPCRDFDLLPFTLKNQNHEYTSFAEVDESFWQIIKSKTTLSYWGLPKLTGDIKGLSCPLTYY